MAAKGQSANDNVVETFILEPRLAQQADICGDRSKGNEWEQHVVKST